MQIAFHIGAHCTDTPVLVNALRRNLDRMPGVAVPEPETYHDLLRDVINELKGRPASPAAQDAILDRILGKDEPRRLVLSNSSFLCIPDRAIEDGALYPLAHKAGWLANIFPDHEVSLHMALRNPASLVPDLFHLQDRSDDLVEFIGSRDPMGLRWVTPIETILASCPRSTLTLWCHEDSPLIWGKVLHAVAGLPPDTHLHGLFDMARAVMSKDGTAKLRAYTSAHPPKTEAARQRIIAAFIDRFGIDSELRAETLGEAWSPEIIAALTDAYEADLARIVALDRVEVLRR